MGRKIERVMLVLPPTIQAKEVTKRIGPPLGVAWIAAVLEDDYEVSILDASIEDFDNEVPLDGDKIQFGLSWEAIKERIAAFAPDVVGVSTMGTDQAANAHKLFKLVKDISQDIVVVAGGVYPTTQPERALADENLDYVVIGEGEDTARHFLVTLAQGGSLVSVDGLGWKEDGHIRMNLKKRFIEDLDRLPLPARHKLRMDLYSYARLAYRFGPRRRPFTSIFTSRSCPASCVFCSDHLIWGKKFRVHSAERVLDELEHLITQYGIRELAFIDDNLTYDKGRALKIFKGMVERRFDLVWSTPNGIALYALDEELIDAMAQAGCYSMYLGIESGVQEVLSKIIHKPLRLDRVSALVKRMKQYDMETVGLFVIGFPGETLEQMWRTVEFAESLDLDYVTFSIATPYPGTQLYYDALDAGLLEESYSEEELVFGFGKGHIRTQGFTPEEVLKIRQEGWQRVNFGTPEKRKKLKALMAR